MKRSSLLATLNFINRNGGSRYLRNSFGSQKPANHIKRRKMRRTIKS